MTLFLAFLLIPIIEIALFIQVGGFIGLFPTLAIVIITAVLGSWLVRNQGLLALGQVRSSFDRLSDPTEPLAHGAMILLAGALLLTPGFFTDAVGFALLVPRVRSLAFGYVQKRVKVASVHMGGRSATYSQRSDRGDVFDGEYTDVTERDTPSGPSGWVENKK